MLDLVAGTVAPVYPGLTAATLVLVIWAIIGEIATSFSAGSPLLALTGICSIVAGGLLVAWPGIGAVTIALLAGGYLSAYGVVLLVSAWRTGPEVGAR